MTLHIIQPLQGNVFLQAACGLVRYRHLETLTKKGIDIASAESVNCLISTMSCNFSQCAGFTAKFHDFIFD